MTETLLRILGTDRTCGIDDLFLWLDSNPLIGLDKRTMTLLSISTLRLESQNSFHDYSKGPTLWKSRFWTFQDPFNPTQTVVSSRRGGVRTVRTGGTERGGSQRLQVRWSDSPINNYIGDGQDTKDQWNPHWSSYGPLLPPSYRIVLVTGTCSVNWRVGGKENNIYPY